MRVPGLRGIREPDGHRIHQRHGILEGEEDISAAANTFRVNIGRE